jgi:cobalt-zinc-cadmium resistance protein CzcA
VTLTIPLSIALSGLLLRPLGVGLNTMTLRGLGIAVGLLVDAAIIMVENILHRLGGLSSADSRRERALGAAAEVARPIAFATLIVIVVFLPLFGMTGIEGRMYQPLAAVIAALILAVTLVPIAAAGLLRPVPLGSDEDVAVLRAVKRWYALALDTCLHHPGRVAVITLLVAAPVVVVGLRIGSDFMPQLDEGAFLLGSGSAASTSLSAFETTGATASRRSGRCSSTVTTAERSHSDSSRRSRRRSARRRSAGKPAPAGSPSKPP